VLDSLEMVEADEKQVDQLKLEQESKKIFAGHDAGEIFGFEILFLVF